MRPREEDVVFLPPETAFGWAGSTEAHLHRPHSLWLPYTAKQRSGEELGGSWEGHPRRKVGTQWQALAPPIHWATILLYTPRDRGCLSLTAGEALASPREPGQEPQCPAFPLLKLPLIPCSLWGMVLAEASPGWILITYLPPEGDRLGAGWNTACQQPDLQSLN